MEKESLQPIFTEGASYFEKVVMNVRGYFVWTYHAGTREMVYRVVRQHLGDVPDKVISKALKRLKDNGEIVYEKRVWWLIKG